MKRRQKPNPRANGTLKGKADGKKVRRQVFNSVEKILGNLVQMKYLRGVFAAFTAQAPLSTKAKEKQHIILLYTCTSLPLTSPCVSSLRKPKQPDEQVKMSSK